MNRIILVVCILLSAGLAVAQKNVTLGKPYGVIDANEKYYFSDGKEILTVKIEKKMIYLQKLNAVTLAFQKVRMYDDFPKGYMIEQIAEINNRYFVFYSLWENEKELLCYREIDFAKGEFINKGTTLMSGDRKISGSLVKTGFYSLGTADKYDFYFSQDTSRVLIQCRYKSEIRNDEKSKDIIGMNVYDDNLNKIWAKEVTMPYTEKKMDNLDYSVDGKGNVYVVARVFDDNSTDLKKRGEDDTNYNIELVKVAASTSAVTTTKVELGDKFTKTIWMFESPKGYMICGGFYNKGKDLADADGIIMFKLGTDGKLFDFTTVEIPLDVLNQYATGKTKRKNSRRDSDDRAELEDLILRSVLVNADGSIILVGEQHFSITRRTSNGNYLVTDFYNDMLITKVAANGKLAWMKKLPKRQIGTAGRGGMSYMHLYNNSQHYLLFLDNEKNVQLPINKVPDRHADGAGGFLTAYHVNDASGDVKKISILDTRDVNGMELYQFKPSRIVPTAAGVFVFEAYKKGKEDILVEVDLTK